MAERFDHQPIPASTLLEQLIGIINRRLGQLARIVGLLQREGNGLRCTSTYIEIEEPEATPAAPTGSRARLFLRETGGKLELCVRFPTGATQVVATEP